MATCNWTCWTTWRKPRGVGHVTVLATATELLPAGAAAEYIVRYMVSSFSLGLNTWTKNLWEDSERLRRNCVQLMHSFVVCQQQQLRTRVSPYWVATNSFGAFSLSCDTVAFYHCVHSKSLFVVVFVGPCPFCCLLCFSAGWRNAYLAGGSAFRLLWCFCLCLFCVVDLPWLHDHSVNVDFISNCFFTCKDEP